jgi:hypothetical protein
MTFSVFPVEERDDEVGERVDDVKMEPGSSRGKQLRGVFDLRDHHGSPLVVRGFRPRGLDKGDLNRTKAV